MDPYLKLIDAYSEDNRRGFKCVKVRRCKGVNGVTHIYRGYRSRLDRNGLGLPRCTDTLEPCVYDVRRFPTLDRLPFTHLHVSPFPFSLQTSLQLRRRNRRNSFSQRTSGRFAGDQSYTVLPGWGGERWQNHRGRWYGQMAGGGWCTASGAGGTVC